MPERLIAKQVLGTRIFREHLARYNFALPMTMGKSVLDVACGSGYGTAHLAANGATHVTGIDASSDAVAYASSNYPSEQVRFVCADAHDLSAIGQVDVVVSFETIEHLADPVKFLREISRVMHDDAVFIVSTPVRKKGSLDQKPKNPFHLREWSIAEFAGLLRQHFSSVDLRFQYDVVDSWYPLSRSLRRLGMKIRSPHRAAEFEQFPVVEQPPDAGGINIEPQYIVALCRGPIK